MSIELKQIAPYLPYGLTWFCLDQDSREYEQLPFVSINLANEELEIGGMDIPIDELPYPNGLTIKPILRPLSDLTKEIEVNGEKLIPIKGMFLPHGERKILTYWANENKCWMGQQISYLIYQELFEMHFDVFGLIEQGLAIDINTLEK
jgi:hypothetical protein